MTALDTDVVRVAALRTAAGASVIAGLIHYAAIPGHRAEGWTSGLFFTVLGAFGFIWAVLIWFSPNVPLVVAAGLAINIGAIALWAVSRTTGLSFGPHGGGPEEIGALDVSAGLAELITLTALVLLVTYKLGPDR